MSDSSDNNELFGSESGKEEVDDEALPGAPPPEYTEQREFINFVSENNVGLH